MRVKFEFIVALAVPAVLAGCGAENGATDTTDPAPSVRSEIAGSAPDGSTIGATDIAEPEAPRVFEPGVSNFESWSLAAEVSVVDGAAEAPDASMTADLLRLGNSGVAGWSPSDLMIEAGDSIEGGVWLWANDPTQVVLQLVRWCSDTESEVATEVVSVTSEPHRYSVSHTFEYAHECVRFQIGGSGQPTTVYAWNASVNRGN